MMKKYKFILDVQELYSKEVEIEAASKEEAEEMAHKICHEHDGFDKSWQYDGMDCSVMDWGDEDE